MFENIDLDRMADEISGSTATQVSTRIPKSVSLHSAHSRGSDSIVSVTSQNDPNLHESEIIMNIQIVSEATHRDGRITDAALFGALQQLLYAVADSENGYVSVVANNGLYPLVGVIRMNINNNSLCLLTLKVSIHMFSDH